MEGILGPQTSNPENITITFDDTNDNTGWKHLVYISNSA